MELDTKELSEVIKGSMELTVAVLEELHDGVQFHDAIAIFAKIQANDDLRRAMVEAAKGAHKIPAELKDISAEEAIQVIMIMLPYVPKMLKALAKGSKG